MPEDPICVASLEDNQREETHYVVPTEFYISGPHSLQQLHAFGFGCARFL